MWHEGNISSALQTCRERESLLLVLIEPCSSIMSGGPTQQTPAEMYARASLAAMHRITFLSKYVQDELSDSRVVCIRLVDDPGSEDVAIVAAVFSLPARPVFLIIGRAVSCMFVRLDLSVLLP
jgi:hypothetical protein